MSSLANHFIQINQGGNALYWVLEAANGIYRAKFERNSAIGQMYLRANFSPKNAFVVLDSSINGSSQGKIALIQLSNAKKIAELDTSINGPQNFGWNSIFAFSPSEIYLAFVSTASAGVSLFDLKQQRIVKNYNLGEKPISSIAFTPDEKQIVTKNFSNGNLSFWDIATGVLLYEYSTGDDFSDAPWSKWPSIIFSNDARFVASHSSNSYRSGIWHSSNRKELVFSTPWFLEPLLYNSIRNVFIIAAAPAGLYIWDPENMKSSSILDDQEIKALAFNTDSSLLAAVVDGQLKIFEGSNFSELCSAPTPEKINQISFNNISNFYTTSNLGPLRFWFLH